MPCSRIHAWQHPGFSTVWANLMSSMPEAEYLLTAKIAEQRASKEKESTIVLETEMVRGFCTGLILNRASFL